jgi:hypothetical protein
MQNDEALEGVIAVHRHQKLEGRSKVTENLKPAVMHAGCRGTH